MSRKEETMRWEIRKKGDVWHSVPHDHQVCEWEIVRQGREETRKVEVQISRTAWEGPGDNTSLLDARKTDGRTVVEEFLDDDDPPTMIEVTIYGFRPLDT